MAATDEVSSKKRQRIDEEEKEKETDNLEEILKGVRMFFVEAYSNAAGVYVIEHVWIPANFYDMKDDIITVDLYLERSECGMGELDGKHSQVYGSLEETTDPHKMLRIHRLSNTKSFASDIVMEYLLMDEIDLHPSASEEEIEAMGPVTSEELYAVKLKGRDDIRTFHSKMHERIKMQVVYTIDGMDVHKEDI